MAIKHPDAYWQPFTKTEHTSQWVAGLDDQFRRTAEIAELPLPAQRGQFKTALTANSFWIIYESARAGKLAVRTCFDPQTIHGIKPRKSTETTAEYDIDGSLGRFRVRVELADPQAMLLRYTTSLKPRQDFSIQVLPRDVYALDEDYNPANTEGMVYITQSGPTAGLAYLSVTKPVEGTILYFQNLTALNEYCQATHSDPSGSVAVQWPEFGFTLPASEQPLSAGKEVVLSDAFLYLSEVIPADEIEASDLFLEAVAQLYRRLPRPDTVYYDWPKAAERTIKALTDSPDCGRIIKNCFYLNAYADSAEKPPESMVQFAILVPLSEYQTWLEQTIPLVDRINQSIPSFYDESKASMVRWLPGEPFRKKETSEEEDANKIDSWYLLHTLMNLGRMAEKGDTVARDLLLRSVDFAIGAAWHFNYNWPVFYDSRTLAVIKAETGEGKGGELDVAGLFTHVMLQVYELTRDMRYLTEAERSAERLRGKGFELLYQSNITLMSALTLVKLWKLTGNRLYFDLSRLSIANLVARMWIWDCGFGQGQKRSTFMGVAPLKDTEYLAAYEEAEIFATMLNYLKELRSEVPEPIRLLFSEYMKYLLHRGRFYFPTELPPDAISQEPREGRIIPDLPIPLEDIATGWKQAGTVGQEVYGGALAYILTTYAYKRFEEMPVTFYSEYPIYQAEYQLLGKDSGYAVFRLGGTAAYTCQVRVLPKGRQLPNVRLFDEDGDPEQPFEPTEGSNKHQAYTVRGNIRLRLEWSGKE